MWTSSGLSPWHSPNPPLGTFGYSAKPWLEVSAMTFMATEYSVSLNPTPISPQNVAVHPQNYLFSGIIPLRSHNPKGLVVAAYVDPTSQLPLRR